MMKRALLGMVVCLLVVPAQAQTIRVATWNLFNLHHLSGEPLRSGALSRSDADYATLREYAARLDADVVALQEFDGPAAAARVFPAQEYEIHVSGRRAEDLATGRATDRIYTGFAVRRGVFDAVTKSDVAELGVMTTHEARPSRWGTELLVARGGRRLRLLAVHLKSGCAAGNLVRPSSDACATLARQRAPLENWVDRRALGDVPFVILGDFNRRFDLHGQNDHLWGEIDDGFPAAVDLVRFPFNRESGCWRGTRNHHAQPIDFIVLDQRAHAMLVPGSFREVDYDAADRDVATRRPSDHCPIAVDLRF